VRRAPPLLLAAVLGAPGPALATGFHELGDDLRPRDEAGVEVSGWLRLRGEGDHNLDLDRGLTAAGRPLYPVSQADPGAQLLAHGDARLRLDAALHAPFGGVAVKVRVDLLDGLTLGGDPGGAPSTANTQRPVTALRLKRAYGEALTPFGLLSAGRMGAQWGLGMLSNGGDCRDCDSGDAADRVSLVTPVAGHLWAVAYDFGFAGPTVGRRGSGRAVVVEPSTDVHTITVAMLRWLDPVARERRTRAGKASLEYGAVLSQRWQTDDVPARYLALADPPALDGAQVVPRDARATVLDGWLRLTRPGLRAELEVAAILGSIGQPSLVPGLLLRDAVSTRAFGAALQTEVGEAGGAFTWGLDAGVASGDPSWGLSAAPQQNLALPPPGELDGVAPPVRRVTRADAFRFHPDFFVDRILFRSIVGTVTGAAYARPHATLRLLDLGRATLRASVAGIASVALAPASTPGGAAPLGLELDPTLAYSSDDGFDAAIDYAVLFPLAGLDNPAEGLPARPAQQVRLRLVFAF
jgi:uncharacterized protein (TIGR04551 family)